MPKLMVFDQITLDGYFSGRDGDYSWAHSDGSDAEFADFQNNSAKTTGRMLFGRKTYELMEAFWPTPEAHKQLPVIAEVMNRRPKVVFSRTLERVSWDNTTIEKGDLVEAVRRMKAEPGDDMIIMGSGTIVSQLTQAGLIDEYEIVMIPVVIGEGRTLFEGVKDKLPFKLARSRAFKNGNVVLWYEPQPRSAAVQRSQAA